MALDEPINFLIVDCEGNSANRCRQIGIISVEATPNSHETYKEYINYKKENPMTIFKTAYGEIVQKNMKFGCKERIVPVFTFGNYDEFLIIRKLEKDKGNFRKNLQQKFVFIDMQKIVTTYLKETMGLKLDKSKSLSLDKMAQLVNANIVFPSHNALADSQTLLNIIIKYDELNKGALYQILSNAINSTENSNTIKIAETKKELNVNYSIKPQFDLKESH